MTHPTRILVADDDQSIRQLLTTIIRREGKPFEIAELGGMIRLCVKGLDQALSSRLYYSSDRAVREFVQRFGEMPDETDT